MRDHRKFKVFELADLLALGAYQLTAGFPSDEKFGLTSQIRRGAVSIASNIVEGCARTTDAEFSRFIEIAHSASRELSYQLSLVRRIDLPLSGETRDRVLIVEAQAEETSKALAGLLKKLRAQSS